MISEALARMTIALPSDPSDEELARDWLLSEDDLTEVRRCRGADKRHSFAIQLCTLRTFGRFLGQDYGVVPVRILNHVGRQFGMPPVLFAAPTNVRKGCFNCSISLVKKSSASAISSEHVYALSQNFLSASKAEPAAFNEAAFNGCRVRTRRT
jgi:hypothetical protein